MSWLSPCPTLGDSRPLAWHGRPPAQPQARSRRISVNLPAFLPIILLPFVLRQWSEAWRRPETHGQLHPQPLSPRASLPLPGLAKRPGFFRRNFCAGKKASFARSSESSGLAMPEETRSRAERAWLAQSS